MEVKELIKELKDCNPNARVTIVVGNEDYNDIDTSEFEIHAKYMDAYIELFIYNERD